MVSIAYALTPVQSEEAEPVAQDDAQSAAWYDIADIYTENDDGGIEMAFDHKEIITEFLLKKYPHYIPKKQ